MDRRRDPAGRTALEVSILGDAHFTADTDAVPRDLGSSAERIDTLRERGSIR